MAVNRWQFELNADLSTPKCQYVASIMFILFTVLIQKVGELKYAKLPDTQSTATAEADADGGEIALDKSQGIAQ